MASIFDAVQTNQQNVPISPAASAFSSSVNTFSQISNEDTFTIPAVNNVTISTFSDHQKIKSAQKNSDYFVQKYIIDSYVRAPSSANQSIGFDPNVQTRYDRGDTNLINSTVNTTTQEQDRYSAFNIVKLDHSRVAVLSNNAASLIASPNAVGSLGNINHLYAKTFINTNNPNTKMIITPNSNQVFLQDNYISQQVEIKVQENS
jgi:hypothetical protein